jgi:glycerophosphoryl diester phosphodiesterase
MKYLGLALVYCLTLACAQAPMVKKEKQDILIIAHRGASGYRPEHTLESYRLAINMGADFIEPDLVMTKDKVLIARHENEISGTTDVAEKFPKLKKTKIIDGEKITGWFTEDLTLKEIKTLKAKERLASRNQSYNGQFEVPTFQEVLTLADQRSRELGRTIGVYPETKHPSYFRSIGLPLEDAVAKELKKFGWIEVTSPVILQSFELSSLEKMKALVNCRLVYLLEDNSTVTSAEELKKVSRVAFGIGPSKRLILSTPSLIEKAHQAGLKVHPYTFRSDKPFLTAEYNQDPKKEYFRFFDLGVDGLFSDFADQAIQARDEWIKN